MSVGLSGQTANATDLYAIVAGTHPDPFSILGQHTVMVDGEEGSVVRAFVPEAIQASVLAEQATRPMSRVHEAGFFEALFPSRVHPMRYRLDLTADSGKQWVIDDPYALPPWLSEHELGLFAEGAYERVYELLGARVTELRGLKGVGFAAWAPNATRVSVVGDFNQWDGRRHPMRLRHRAGLWELFIPGMDVGALYKFELLGPNGELLPLKSDPVGFLFETPPRTATIVHDLNHYVWGDAAWMRNRWQSSTVDQPMVVYEVHLGSWKGDPKNGVSRSTYRQIAAPLIEYVSDLGFTHIQLLPLSEHPSDDSWGYQATGYYAPTSRYGAPEDLMYLIDQCHQHGIGVLMDWTPAHFAPDEHGLCRFDGTCLFEHLDPSRGIHPRWKTLLFNIGRNEVAAFLIGNAIFWLDKYHFDGIRVDAVAAMLYLDHDRQEDDWIRNQFGGPENFEAIAFFKRLNDVVQERYPGVLTIAEDSTAFPRVTESTGRGGLGFSLKWNLGWMNRTLKYMQRDPVYRSYHHHDELTFPTLYAFSEQFLLALSHDEVVHCKGSLLDKMPGTALEQFANLRLLLGYMYLYPGKKLLFMGGEFGQRCEWCHNRSLSWHFLENEAHQGIQNLVRDLNRLVRREPALHELDCDPRGFQWIDLNDTRQSVISFLRKGEKEEELLVAVCNFTPLVRTNYRVGVPRGGLFRELLNSDSRFYAGSNVGNSGAICAETVPWQGFPLSLSMTLPPLAVLVLKPVDAAP